MSRRRRCRVGAKRAVGLSRSVWSGCRSEVIGLFSTHALGAAGALNHRLTFPHRSAFTLIWFVRSSKALPDPSTDFFLHGYRAQLHRVTMSAAAVLSRASGRICSRNSLAAFRAQDVVKYEHYPGNVDNHSLQCADSLTVEGRRRSQPLLDTMPPNVRLSHRTVHVACCTD